MIEKDNKKLNIIGIIPARGGSKGVPRKNIKLLGDKPLIAYSIESAKKSKYLDRIIVSTEDKEIAEIAKKYSAEVIMRPLEMATDSAPTEPSLIHVVEELKKNENDTTHIVVLLQVTSPFRKAEDIDKALEQLIKHPTADSIYSVYEAPNHFNPHWISRIDDDGFVKPYLGDSINLNRQSLPKVYWRDGQIYVVYADKLIKTGSRFGENGVIPYINTTDKYHINIDTELDFMLAELIVEKNLI
ncbi:MAG: acylneuraminate cytidylyltransferase family protein [Candidatus Kuenenbacteria bacterium]